MNELVIMHDKQAVTTSLVLAEVFEKQHKNVIQAIEAKIEPAENQARYKRMFYEGIYTDKKGEQRKMYYLNRERANLLYKIANLTSDEELKEESLKSSYELVTGKLIHQKKTDYQKLYEAVTERYGDSVEDNLKGAIRFIRVWKG
ncbi:Rha family transcriptional regulator [Ligilactobacillus salivarius]|uniref:Phage regulatory protein n=1 Tax=Ligilactobacillus salivarius TaxID=1624 RepID=A0A1V9TW64_9LACO|nr:Rha family transcriptional regulator [Ligilactobacillus salivarius]OQR21571.1 hypothetical protein B6U39_03890 [Ligilactobacillus salivarius]OQR23646.1 hypothetical protein B6U38_03920 [Ligilactobacillus salivarius]OQR25639.1 hypothetical protein B6U37_03905 [Ligilactobacillus salivarius]